MLLVFGIVKFCRFRLIRKETALHKYRRNFGVPQKKDGACSGLAFPFVVRLDKPFYFIGNYIREDFAVFIVLSVTALCKKILMYAYENAAALRL